MLVGDWEVLSWLVVVVVCGWVNWLVCSWWLVCGGDEILS